MSQTSTLAAEAEVGSNLIEPTPSAYQYPLLIKQLLHTPLVQAPGQEIVYKDASRYDYRALRRRIGQLGNALTTLGVGNGDTIGVLDWDSHRYLECFFGVPMLGAVLHTVNIRLSPEQILYTINHAEDDVLLVHTDFLPLLEAIYDRVESVKQIVLMTDSPGEHPATALPVADEYEHLLASQSDQYEFPDFDENTRATTFYTTGTTGLPKGVAFSHRQLVLHTLAGMAMFGSGAVGQRLDRADVYMPITPMFHVHAWGIPYIATALGLKQVYPGRYAPDGLLSLIQREQVTFSHCVPTILHMLLNTPSSRDVDLSRWKVIIGGSALPRALATAALDRGIDVFTGYGMSETCPILTIAQLMPDEEYDLETRVKAGRAIPLVDLRVVDDEMRELAHDGSSSGEVVARAPWLTQGYYKEVHNSESLWRGGYLHTGDIGVIDERGYLQITDRIKDVIKSGGEWISSLDIEDILTQHPLVSEAAVIGIPDERWGERPMALIVCKQLVAEDEIKDHVRHFADRGVISRWAVPSRVCFVETLDKTSVGKLDKKLMRQKYAG
jgi:fatty-acyl-CoA synthase